MGITDLEDFDIIVAAPIIFHPAVAAPVSLSVADTDACNLTHTVVHTDDHSAGHCQISDGEHYGEKLFHGVKICIFADM